MSATSIFTKNRGDGGLRNDYIITTSSLYARVQHVAPKSAACITFLVVKEDGCKSFFV
jgi:hypothetical protein